MQHPVVAAAALGVRAVGVVQVLRAVQRDADQEAVLGKKLAPFPVDQQAVRLDGKRDGAVMDIFLLAERDRPPEKRQPGQGGLPALKGDGAAVGGLGQDLFQHRAEGVDAHQPIAGDLPLAGLIGVKAVPAAHVAQAAGRFEHHGHTAHAGSPFSPLARHICLYVIIPPLGGNFKPRGMAVRRLCPFRPVMLYYRKHAAV